MHLRQLHHTSPLGTNPHNGVASSPTSRRTKAKHISRLQSTALLRLRVVMDGAMVNTLVVRVRSPVTQCLRIISKVMRTILRLVDMSNSSNTSTNSLHQEVMARMIRVRVTVVVRMALTTRAHRSSRVAEDSGAVVLIQRGRCVCVCVCVCVCRRV